ncbi:YolD-like family protein [Lysinibacillus sp. Bpr_S20]|uniref:YolD-like family protein n=1 Tax=Lysinibacillus sp. Bpr_S20 TaxID=2933964 RepID=UPI0020120DB8|nr:YolD-like family protein [Lysinibacillus sp. Bpr_S20]MCL1701645.1 YolD-like family protein [Lysinibacillus sp. Bpr_S20]
MLKDRGSMKWTAMMLPEHLVEIKKWKEEQFHDKKRELTEWELEEIEQKIQRAFKSQKLVTLTMWQNNNLRDEKGLVTGMDPLKKELILDADISVKRISFNDIQDAKLIDADD